MTTYDLRSVDVATHIEHDADECCISGCRVFRKAFGLQRLTKSLQRSWILARRCCPVAPITVKDPGLRPPPCGPETPLGNPARDRILRFHIRVRRSKDSRRRHQTLPLI